MRAAEVELGFWFGVFGPRGMPNDVKTKLEPDKLAKKKKMAGAISLRPFFSKLIWDLLLLGRHFVVLAGFGSDFPPFASKMLELSLGHGIGVPLRAFFAIRGSRGIVGCSRRTILGYGHDTPSHTRMNNTRQ